MNSSPQRHTQHQHIADSRFLYNNNHNHTNHGDYSYGNNNHTHHHISNLMPTSPIAADKYDIHQSSYLTNNNSTRHHLPPPTNRNSHHHHSVSNKNYNHTNNGVLTNTRFTSTTTARRSQFNTTTNNTNNDRNVQWSGRTPYVRYVDNQGKALWCLKGVDPHRVHRELPHLELTTTKRSPSRSGSRKRISGFDDGDDHHHDYSKSNSEMQHSRSPARPADNDDDNDSSSSVLRHCWRPKKDPHTGNTFYVNMYLYRKGGGGGGGNGNGNGIEGSIKKKVWVLPDISSTHQKKMNKELKQQQQQQSAGPSHPLSSIMPYTYGGSGVPTGTSGGFQPTTAPNLHPPTATGGFTITSVVDPVPHCGQVLSSSSSVAAAAQQPTQRRSSATATPSSSPTRGRRGSNNNKHDSYNHQQKGHGIPSRITSTTSPVRALHYDHMDDFLSDLVREHTLKKLSASETAAEQQRPSSSSAVVGIERERKEREKEMQIKRNNRMNLVKDQHQQHQQQLTADEEAPPSFLTENGVIRVLVDRIRNDAAEKQELRHEKEHLLRAASASPPQRHQQHSSVGKSSDHRERHPPFAAGEEEAEARAAAAAASAQRATQRAALQAQLAQEEASMEDIELKMKMVHHMMNVRQQLML